MGETIETERNSRTESDPPYPSDLEAKGWSLELDYERIEQSDTWAIASAEQRPWLLMLWLVAWKQSPVASLPSDHRLIAARLRLPIDQFSKWADVLLRDWFQATDGRLYTKALSDQVIKMIKCRSVHKHRKHRLLVIETHGNFCAYCLKSDVKLTLDHVVARSKGGSDCPENLVPACKSCNSSKRDKSLSDWIAKR